MSNDPLMDHLEMQSDMIDRGWHQPCCYATTPEQDAEIDQREQQKCAEFLKARLEAHYSALLVSTREAL